MDDAIERNNLPFGWFRPVNPGVVIDPDDFLDCGGDG